MMRQSREPELLRGTVEGGESDASKWLTMYNNAYALKLGTAIFPGSLNLRLQRRFDWSAARHERSIIHFYKEEYGGERDILLLPCILTSLGSSPAFLWSAVHPTMGARSTHVIEILAAVKLRDAYGLVDGTIVEVEVG